jgi:hypothetical protein
MMIAPELAALPDRKIVTEHIFPPIPVRQFDWLAHFDDPEGLTGHGATENEAIDQLLDKACDWNLTSAEQIAQAARCSCRGADDLCACQNTPDNETRAERRRSFGRAG